MVPATQQPQSQRLKQNAELGRRIHFSQGFTALFSLSLSVKIEKTIQNHLNPVNAALASLDSSLVELKLHLA